jgi:uncharacterized membrane protein YfcA
MEQLLIILLLICIAFLYSSVGHGGASGYLGMMVLLGISPLVIKPSALLLNIIVSAIATIQFYRAGYFRKELLIPFIILSVPFSFIGSTIQLSDHIYKIILGFCLLMSVVRMLFMNQININSANKKIPLTLALFIGALIGFISGMIGIGGGILLSPVLLLFRWANIKESAAVAAPFIFFNSLSGIAGIGITDLNFTPQIITWVIAASIGGIAGSYWGSAKFNFIVLKYLLSAVLIIAAGKLFIS